MLASTRGQEEDTSVPILEHFVLAQGADSTENKLSLNGRDYLYCHRPGSNMLLLVLFPFLLWPFWWKPRFWWIKSRGIRMLGWPCSRIIIYTASVGRAQVQVGSDRRGIGVGNSVGL